MSTYESVVVGATGAVGSALVRELCASSRCTAVVAIVRRQTAAFDGVSGADKIRQHVVDMAELERETQKAAAGCSVAFCTMGIGQPSKVSKEELWKVDFEHATAFARGCKAAGVQHISLLTAVAADSKSRSRYLHVKGAVEDAYRALGFARTTLFRPSVLATKNIRYGLQDRLTQSGFPLVSWILPSRFHEVSVEDLGRAMRVNAEREPGADPVEVLHYADFVALAKGG